MYNPVKDAALAFVKRKQMFLTGGLLALSVALVGCGSGGAIGGLFDKLPDAEPKTAKQVAQEGAPVDNSRGIILSELQALRAELQKRSGRLSGDLTAAKAELARRQSAGEIDPSKVNLSPAQIRDTQESELDKLKAELARRQSNKEVKEKIISVALTENEAIYRNVDACLMRPSGDFRNTFEGRSDLTKIVDEKKSQLYQNSDKTLLILTTDENCDISFTGTNVDDYAVGLVHILETQGGIVETKNLAGINVISVAHPRGNFRLASGRKAIGQGGSTNLYTTIKAL